MSKILVMSKTSSVENDSWKCIVQTFKITWNLFFLKKIFN